MKACEESRLNASYKQQKKALQRENQYYLGECTQLRYVSKPQPHQRETRSRTPAAVNSSVACTGPERKRVNSEICASIYF